MRAILLTHFALAAAACGLILAAADFASAGSAVVTIGQLRAQGLDVRVDRFGSASLSETVVPFAAVRVCEVTNVRNPREGTEFVPIVGGRRGTVPVSIAPSR